MPKRGWLLRSFLLFCPLGSGAALRATGMPVIADHRLCCQAIIACQCSCRARGHEPSKDYHYAMG